SDRLDFLVVRPSALQGPDQLLGASLPLGPLDQLEDDVAHRAFRDEIVQALVQVKPAQLLEIRAAVCRQDRVVELLEMSPGQWHDLTSCLEFVRWIPPVPRRFTLRSVQGSKPSTPARPLSFNSSLWCFR